MIFIYSLFFLVELGFFVLFLYCVCIVGCVWYK